MAEDVVRALGYLTLGSRLKRLGEQLQSQAEAVLQAHGSDLSASHFPLLAALDRLGAMGVGQLAQALGVSQPGVTRLLARLEADGLVGTEPGADDRRRRTVALTKAGRALVARCKKTAFPRIEAAVAEACAAPDAPLLAQLARLEAALQEAPLAHRVQRQRRSAS
jgi:DNA-binding MarR family transcriptional regulator